MSGGVQFVTVTDHTDDRHSTVFTSVLRERDSNPCEKSQMLSEADDSVNPEDLCDLRGSVAGIKIP